MVWRLDLMKRLKGMRLAFILMNPQSMFSSNAISFLKIARSLPVVPAWCAESCS